MKKTELIQLIKTTIAEADNFAGSDPKSGSTIKSTGFNWKQKGPAKLPNGDVHLGLDGNGKHKVESNGKVKLNSDAEMIKTYGKGWGKKLKESSEPTLNESSEFDSNYNKYHTAMGNMYKIISKQDKGLTRKFAKAWQAVEDVLDNYIGD